MARRLISWCGTPESRPAFANGPRARRLRVEHLEDRCLLANAPPVIAALNDSPDPLDRGPVVLTASDVSDPDATGWVATVSFYRESNGTPDLQATLGGDELIGVDYYADGGWALKYWYPGLPLGTYTYYAQATDNEGASSTAVSTTNTIANHLDHQIIAGPMATIHAAPGASVSFPVSYTTSTIDNTLIGLGLRLHYNSAVLTYDGLSQVLSESLFLRLGPSDDSLNHDNDPTTDKFVHVAWVDAEGAWPNVELPARLFVADFTAASGATSGTVTQLNFTDSSSPGTGIESWPIMVQIDESPTISHVVDQATSEDLATGAIGFTVGDAETAAGELSVSGSSSNPSLVPNGNIVFGGNGADRTMTITPAANQYGTATITLTVTDSGGGSANETFLLTVESANDLPVITAISSTPDPVFQGGEITLTATGVADVFDPEGSVALVDFYRESNGSAGLQTGAGGDTWVGSDADATAGWSIAASTAGLELGTYTYYARATDNEGAASAAAATTNTVQAPPDRQIVSDTAATLSGMAGQNISFPVRYTTSTGDNTLSGLGLRVHYNSSLLVYNGLESVLSSALIGQQSPVDDSGDWDSDPSTDKYVLAWWADISGNWPSAGLPTQLFVASFLVAADAAEGVQTRVRFSATSTAPGYSFESQPITVQVSGQSQDPASLDADGNGTADALTDGILILRYLFDPDGAWEVAGALGAGATRSTRDAVKSFLDTGQASVLDVDANGAADALTDGILILRYLFDPNGEWTVADALGTGSTRTVRTDLRSFLNQYNPDTATAAAASTATGGADSTPAVATPSVAALPPADTVVPPPEADEAVASGRPTAGLAARTADPLSSDGLLPGTTGFASAPESTLPALDAIGQWERQESAPAPDAALSITPVGRTEEDAAVDRLLGDGNLDWWLRKLCDDASLATDERGIEGFFASTVKRPR